MPAEPSGCAYERPPPFPRAVARRCVLGGARRKAKPAYAAIHAVWAARRRRRRRPEPVADWTGDLRRSRFVRVSRTIATLLRHDIRCSPNTCATRRAPVHTSAHLRTASLRLAGLCVASLLRCFAQTRAEVTARKLPHPLKGETLTPGGAGLFVCQYSAQSASVRQFPLWQGSAAGHGTGRAGATSRKPRQVRHRPRTKER